MKFQKGDKVKVMAERGAFAIGDIGIIRTGQRYNDGDYKVTMITQSDYWYVNESEMKLISSDFNTSVCCMIDGNWQQKEAVEEYLKVAEDLYTDDKQKRDELTQSLKDQRKVIVMVKKALNKMEGK